jgi:hypothetical protein
LVEKNTAMRFSMSFESDARYDDFEDALVRIYEDVGRRVRDYMKDRSYGSEIEFIGVIPIIIKFDDQMEKEGWFRERVYLNKRNKSADIRLRIDYDRFVHANDSMKRLLVIDNAVKSIRAIAKEAKKDFRARELEEDILRLFGLTLEDLAAVASPSANP